MVFRKRLFGKHISCHLETARPGRRRQCFKIHDRRPAHQHKEAPWPDQRQFPLPQKALVFRGDTGKDKDRV